MLTDLTLCLPESDDLKEYEEVDILNHLCSTIEISGGSLAEIWHRIFLGKSTMTRQQNVKCNRKICNKTRKRVNRILVLPVFVRGRNIDIGGK